MNIVHLVELTAIDSSVHLVNCTGTAKHNTVRWNLSMDFQTSLPRA